MVTLAAVLFFSILGNVLLQHRIQLIQNNIDSLQSQIIEIKEAQLILHDNQKQLEQLAGSMNSFLSQWQVDIFQSTAYAPLDNQSGLCADDNPEVMASMVSTADYLNTAVAVDTSLIPFHTPMWVQGLGWREALDTGGMIKGKKLDIAMTAYADAVNYGRKDVIVVWPRQRE